MTEMKKALRRLPPIEKAARQFISWWAMHYGVYDSKEIRCPYIRRLYKACARTPIKLSPKKVRAK